MKRILAEGLDPLQNPLEGLSGALAAYPGHHGIRTQKAWTEIERAHEQNPSSVLYPGIRGLPGPGEKIWGQAIIGRPEHTVNWEARAMINRKVVN